MSRRQRVTDNPARVKRGSTCLLFGDCDVLLSPGQVLQAVRAAHVLLRPHVRAVLPVGGVSVGGLLCPRCAAVHPGAERHLAGQQRRSHVGKQALRQHHKPSGEQVRRVWSHRYVSLDLAVPCKYVLEVYILHTRKDLSLENWFDRYTCT